MPEERALEVTKKGFCCSYVFSEGSLLVLVWERRRSLDLTPGGSPDFWFNHASIGVCFSVTRDGAWATIEHLVQFFDDDLVATLWPIWEAWEAASLAPAVTTGENLTTATGALH